MANMSKSIFIIDTPACCGECPMSGTDVCREWNMKEAQTFPKDCPLKSAYDVDKVVEQLEERIKNFKSLNSDDEIVDVAVKEIQRDIEIVKSGGIE